MHAELRALQLMYGAFRGSSEWPTFQYLSTQVWQELAIEARDLYYDLSANDLVRPRIDRPHGALLRPDTRVAANLAALTYLQDAIGDVGRFIEIVRYIGERAAGFRPSSPTQVEHCQLAGEEIKRALQLPAADTSFLRQAELLRKEAAILWISWNGPDPSGAWSITIDPERARQFRNITTVVDFLEVQNEIHVRSAPLSRGMSITHPRTEGSAPRDVPEMPHRTLADPAETVAALSRPSMFIGSSEEGKRVAQALQAELEQGVDTTIWSQGVFGLSERTLEALDAKIRDFDFAVLVLTPDDLVSKREATGQSPRDNVVFEAGLCLGALGRLRVFLVACKDDDLNLPTDLAGITMVYYRRRRDGNLQGRSRTGGHEAAWRD